MSDWACYKYECFDCGKGFEEPEDGRCPHCQKTDFMSKKEFIEEEQNAGLYQTEGD